MEELATWHASGSKWSLNTDKLLFKAIQDLSGDIMSSIQRLETDLSNIESDVRIMSLKAGHAAASFNELCQTQYIQQVMIGSLTQTIMFSSYSHIELIGLAAVYLFHCHSSKTCLDGSLWHHLWGLGWHVTSAVNPGSTHFWQLDGSRQLGSLNNTSRDWKDETHQGHPKATTFTR